MGGINQIGKEVVTFHFCLTFKSSSTKQLFQFSKFSVLKRKLREILGEIDYTHIFGLFLNKNDRKLKHQQDIHSKKLFDLGFENSQTTHDPDKVIFNYSSHVLTESE